MSKRIAVIDADTALYQAALRGQVTDASGEVFPLLDVEHCYRDLERRYTNIMLGATRSDARAYLCFTSKDNFRKKILPTYKGQRTAKPVLLEELKAMFLERKPWPCVLIGGLEADDVCGILAGSLQKQGKDPIICSEDKDLLQIPGLLYRQKEVVEVTRETGDKFHMAQTLHGDMTDNYHGCPGIGAKKALRILSAVPKEDGLIGMWKAVVAAYEARDLTEADALVQAQVARILRLEDWDGVKKEPILWQAPRA